MSSNEAVFHTSQQTMVDIRLFVSDQWFSWCISLCPVELQNANDIASHIWPEQRQHSLIRFACSLLTDAWPCLSSPKAFTVSADGPEMYSKRSGKSDWQVFCVFCVLHRSATLHTLFQTIWPLKIFEDSKAFGVLTSSTTVVAAHSSAVLQVPAFISFELPRV